ncbi:MAG: C25 family cysteine peptidase, partial [Lentisphaerales bacterium]|nr:C25 family cysteine peptidase [Lentisphaerales bacterium]
MKKVSSPKKKHSKWWVSTALVCGAVLVWNLPDQYESQRPVISKKVSKKEKKLTTAQKRVYKGFSQVQTSQEVIQSMLDNPGQGSVKLIPGSDLSSAVVTTERISPSHVKLKVSFPHLQIEEQTLADGLTYQSISLPGSSTKSLGEGMPTLPVKPLMVRIPNGRNFNIYHSVGESYVMEGVNLAPEQVPTHPDEPVKAFSKHDSFYKKNTLFPASDSYKTQRVSMRHKEFVQVLITPVQYNPQSQELVITPTVEVDVKVDESMANDQDVSALYSRAFEEMVSDGDFAFVKASSGTDDESTTEDTFAEKAQASSEYLPTLPLMPAGDVLEKYMVIYNDQFEENTAFKALLEWKRQKGYDVIPVKTSEISGGSSKCTKENIDSYLKALTDAEWPTYLLMVGNNSKTLGVPMHSRFTSWNINTKNDHYYSLRSYNQQTNEDWADNLDPSQWLDEYPDCLMGRIPANDNAMLTRIITKVMQMDRAPLLDSSHYSRSITTGAYDGALTGPETFADNLSSYFEQSKFDTDGIANTAANDTNVIRAFNGKDYTAGQWIPRGQGFLWPARSLSSHQTVRGEWQVSEGFVNKNLPSNAVVLDTLKEEWSKGAALINYICHGSDYGWHWNNSGKPFVKEDAAALNSGGKFSMVMDWSCSTAKWVSGENLTQTLLQNMDGGAYAMISSPEKQWGGYQDYLFYGYLAGRFDDYFSYFADHFDESTDDDSVTYPAYANPITPLSFIPGQGKRFGQMLWCGKAYINEHYPAEKISTSIDNPPQPITNRAAYENMHMQTLFADPEAFFHYTAPQVLDVTHTTTLASANGTDTVTVNVKSANSHVANALVALYHPAMGIHSATYSDADGNATFTIPVDTAGVVKVTVTAVDHCSYEGTVVIGANDAPVFTEATESIGTAYPGKFFVDSISAYAMDANSDIMTYEKIDGPEWIKVSSSGAIFGIPAIGDQGNNTVTVKVTDGSGSSDTMTFSIYSAPDSKNDFYTTLLNTDLSAPAPGVLANDLGSFNSAHINSQPANGSVTLNEDGSFDYTPAAGFYGEDSFTYFINDGVANSLSSKVTITVNADQVASWHMDEASGSAIMDASAYQNDGTLTKVSWANGVTGSALSFNGSKSQVSIPDSPELRLTKGSVLFWMKTSAAPSTKMYIAGKTRYTQLSGWQFAVETDGTLSGQLAGPRSSDAHKIIGPAVNDANWHHVALTYEDGKACSLYVDGKLIGTKNSIYYTYSSSDPLYMGKSIVSGFVPYNGVLDDFKVYGRSLSHNEIGAIYQASNPAPTTVDDNYVTVAGQALPIAAPGVLVNDTTSTGSLSTSLQYQPVNGSVSMSADGAFVYTPSADFIGSDSFTYTATNEEGYTSVGSVKVIVGDMTVPVDSNNDGTYEITDIGAINWLSDNNELGPFSSLANKLSASYALSADVDMSGNPNLKPIGSLTAPFKGSFDGKGFAITNISMNYPAKDGVALFSATDNAQIVNVTIAQSSFNGNSKVAALIGNAQSSTVDNCSVNASISATSNAGGLIGCATSSVIDNSSAKGSLTVSGNNTGGLIGHVNTCTISGSSTDVSVSGAGSYHAGFIGYQLGITTITNCYARGNVSSTGNFAAGFMGFIRNATLNFCYSSGDAADFDFSGDVFKSAATFNSCVYRADASAGPANEGKGTFNNCLEVTDIAGLQNVDNFDDWDFGPATAENAGYFWSMSSDLPKYGSSEEEPPAADEFTVIFRASPECLDCMGTTIVGEATQAVVEGESTRSVTVNCAEGYYFHSWSDGNTDNPRVVENITSNLVFEAICKAHVYSVNFTAAAGGSISGDDAQSIEHDTPSEAVTAIANEGYTFIGWSGDLVSTQNPLTIASVTANMNITAKFEQNNYTVTFNAGDHGTFGSSNTMQISGVGHGTAVSDISPADFLTVTTAGIAFTGWNVQTVIDEITVTAQYVFVAVSTEPLDSNGNGQLDIKGIGELLWLSDDSELGSFSTLTDKLRATYELTSDLDMSSVSDFSPIGSSSVPFKGTLNGNGFAISNLTINTPDKDYVALIAYSYKATINDLTLSTGEITGKNYVGGLIASCRATTISNVTCAALVDAGGNNSGLLAGAVYGSTISASKAIGYLESSGTNAGGLVGYLYRSDATHSYADVEVSGTGVNHGGFSGKTQGSTVTYSYAKGNVSSSGGNAAGFTGYMQGGVVLEFCYSSGNATDFCFSGDVNKNAPIVRFCAWRKDASSGAGTDGGKIENCSEVANMAELQTDVIYLEVMS